MYKYCFKRIFDFVGSLILLPIVGIAFVIVGPLIYWEDKGTVLYKAKRRGQNGKVFEMYKFRTMKMNAPDIRNEDNSTYNAPDDPRITKVGKILRKSSIDELPQVVNVLKGDMSFIGPRPVTIEKPLEEYDKKRKVRLKVRPGVTGYTQAYYRNSISQEEKLKLDAIYAQNVSFILDVKIFIKTIITVVTQKNVYGNEGSKKK